MHFFIDSIKAALIVFVIISISATSVSNNDLGLISSSGNETSEMTYGEKILSSLLQSESSSQTDLLLPRIPRPYLSFRRRRRQSLKTHHLLPAPLGEDKKKRLAKIMKDRYLEFRRKLEQQQQQSKEEERDPLYQNRIPAKDSSHFQVLPHQSPPDGGRPIFVPSSFFESTKINKNKNSETVAIQSSNFSPFSMVKKLRSADEAPSSSRSSGIRPGSLPFIPLTRPPITTTGAQASQRASETATHNVLDERLGPSARPTFDPSIVVDFYSLLQATRQTHGLPRIKPHQGRNLRTSHDSHPEPQLLLQSESSEEVKVVRRKLKHQPLREHKFLSFDSQSLPEQKLTSVRQQHHEPVREKSLEHESLREEQKESLEHENIREEQQNASLEQISSEQFTQTHPDEQIGEEHFSLDRTSPSSSEQKFKRDQQELLHNEEPLQTKKSAKYQEEEKSEKDLPLLDQPSSLSLSSSSSSSSSSSQPKSKRAQFLQLPSNVGQNSTMDLGSLSLYISTSNSAIVADDNKTSATKKEVGSEFGPHSDGNDPKAGVDPSNIDVPDLDLSTIHLPQGVRDSLRKYLKPLISTLKPLRKSVPGLPGLDYPILSVVPYTNFYCSNMPWPGFYADTEARCQTWHACDIDGRQSTFLCPNGTVFNQALMVCDWWYNTDCLAAPFLYPLNERLFGNSKPEPVAPYTRITPELLDTIFSP